METRKCLRCPELGRKEANETGKLINGLPVCSECMIQDALGNRGHVIDYSFLESEKDEEIETKVDKPKASVPRKKRG